jgi:hypothetical protein
MIGDGISRAPQGCAGSGILTRSISTNPGLGLPPAARALKIMDQASAYWPRR